MQVFDCKLVAVKTIPRKSKLPAVFLLSAELLVASLWHIACSTSPAAITQQIPEAKFQAESCYITPEAYEQMKIGFLGKNLVIMELTRPVEQISILRGSDAVSFTSETMPKDLQQLLQKYNMNTGEDFYSYVLKYTNRFIFCPRLISGLSSYPVTGIATKLYTLYPGENITLINMRDIWTYSFSSSWAIASTMVHEAAHHKLSSLIREGKIFIKTGAYYQTEERYALINELEYCYLLLRDTFKFASEYSEITRYMPFALKLV
jgi:hypothetical protein